jgi:hypothetical protein
MDSVENFQVGVLLSGDNIRPKDFITLERPLGFPVKVGVQLVPLTQNGPAYYVAINDADNICDDSGPVGGSDGATILLSFIEVFNPSCIALAHTAGEDFNNGG